jgi:zinc transport system permease protein
MIEPFLLHAWLAGVGMALMAGPLGCFIAWQRLAYFGDTIAHAALLGVVLGFVLRVDVTVGIVCTSVLLALLLAGMQRQRLLAADTLLGVLAHGALALGLVLLALNRRIQVDINAYLFGDILTVSPDDLALIYGAAACVIALLAALWPKLLMMVMSRDIAQVEGVPVAKLRLLLMLMIALVVAVSIKVVGMLLMTSMLIVPAAGARFLARSPLGMAVGAALLGVVAVSGGLWISYMLDTPSGPSIILAAIAVLIFAFLVSLRPSFK